MLDLVQTLAILRLLEDKKSKSTNTDENGFFYYLLAIIFIPIIFFSLPLIYLLIYCPYKWFNRTKTNIDQQIGNTTFAKYLIAAIIYSSLLILFLTKVLPFDLAFILFTFIFYILYGINILIDFIHFNWVTESS